MSVHAKGATGLEVPNYDFDVKMLHIAEGQVLPDLSQPVEAKQDSKSRKSSKKGGRNKKENGRTDGVWYLSARRANLFFSTTPQYRPWFLSVASPTSKKAVVFVVESTPKGEGVRKERKRHKKDEPGGVQDLCITPTWLVKAVQAAVVEWDRRPAKLVVVSMPRGSWRPTSARTAGKEVARILAGGGIQVVESSFGEVPESKAGSVLTYSGPARPGADFRAEVGVSQFVADVEIRMELSMRENGSMGGVPFLASLPSMAEKCPDLSVSTLRLVFETAKEFHDSAVWETLSNYEPLEVTVGERTLFAVVAGYTSYAGRGLYMHNSLENAKRGGPDSCFGLQFKTAQTSMFGDLDSVAEFNLPLAAEPLGESYPLWFCKSAISDEPITIESIKADYSAPMKHEDLVALSLACRAIIEWTKRFAVRASGFSGINLKPGPVILGILNGGLSKSGETSVTVTPRPFHPAEVGEMGTNPKKSLVMSIGSSRKCNFCLKPKVLASLTKCSGCQVIRYCSDRCLEADRPRHVDEEKECLRLQEMRDSCAVCGARAGPNRKALKVCSKCKLVRYCSQEHQLQDWKAQHKAECKNPDEW